MQGLMKIATEVDATAVLLATLIPEVPQELADLMLSLGKRYNKPANIVSVRDNKIVDLNNPNRHEDISKIPIYTRF